VPSHPRRASTPRQRVQRGSRLDHDALQRCTRCGEEKAATDFHRRENGQLKSWCRQCWNAWRQQYRKAHPEATSLAYRRDNVARKGLTEEQFVETYELQEGRCAICRDPIRLYREGNGRGGKGAAAVDHDHQTGKFRALLCGKCNTGLGLFNEDPELLLVAAAYLVVHNESVPNEIKG